MTTINRINEYAEIDAETLDEYSKTADELLKVRELDFENTQYLAKVLFCLARYDESAEQFERALAIKSDAKIIENLAICHFRNGDFKKAVRNFELSLEITPKNESALSHLMLSFELLGDLRGAIEWGKKILKLNPENTECIKRLIDYHYELEEFEVCLRYIRQIDYQNPYRQALILYKAARYEECIEIAGKIRTAEAYLLTGRAHLKAKNTAKAVKYLYKSYEKDNNIDTLFEICEIYFRAEDHQRAIHYLKEILLEDSENVKAHEKIAYAYYQSNHWQEAIEYARNAIEINPKTSNAYVTLAEAHIQLFEFEKSKEIIEDALAINPESSELWREMGGLCFSDDLVGFYDSYKKAIDLDPTDCRIYIEFIRLLIMIEEIEAAKIFYNQMLLVNPLFEKSFDELLERYQFN